MESALHRLLSGLLCLMFLSFAALQFNDPDPWVWVPIYVIPAAFCLGNAFRPLPDILRRFFRPLPLSMLAAVSLMGAFLLWPEQYQGLTGKMDSRPGVELARESLGLCIVALGFFYLAWRNRSRRPQPAA